ncbi:MAG: beta strand repeat-containing protein [Phycisphaerales bacterium]
MICSKSRMIHHVSGRAVSMEALEGRSLFSSTLYDAPTTLLTDTVLDAVATADFNADGRMDIASVGSSGGRNVVSVYFQSVSRPGEFLRPTQVLLPVSVRDLAVADGNGDNRPDLFVADAFGRSVYQILNQGGGQFGSASSLVTFANFGDTRKLVVADLTAGDSFLDIAVADSNGLVSIRTRTVSNTVFNPEQTFSTGTVNVDIDSGDFDADGDRDLVIAGRSGTSGFLDVRLNNSSGTFSAGTQVAASTSVSAVAVGDLNGDGRADLAAVGNSSSGALTTHRSYAAGGTLAFQSLLDQPLNTGRGVAIADIDLDNDVDIVASAWNGSQDVVVVFRTNSTSSVVSREEYPISTSAVVLANLDSDAAPDLVGMNSQGVAVAFNYGYGQFAGAPLLTRNAGLTASLLVAGDADNDGDDDVFTVNSGTQTNTVLFHRNLGGFFQLPENLSPTSIAADIESVAVGDVNGDGRRDVVMMEEGTDRLLVRLGNNLGSFATDILGLQSASSIDDRGFILADVNRDGRADAIFCADFDSVGIAFGNANGTFTAEQVYGLGFSGLSHFAVGDLNGDFFPDIAVAESSSQLSVLRNAGDGTFFGGDARYLYDLPHFPNTIRIAQMSGGSDSLPEVVYSSDQGLFSLTNSSTAQTISLSSGISAPGSFDNFVAGDVDGDGDADLLARASDIQLRPIRNDGGAFSLRPLVATSGRSPAIGRFDQGFTLDVAALNGGSRGFETLFNIGNGNFGATSRTVRFGTSSYDKLLSAELTGDSLADLVALDNSRNEVARFSNSSTGFVDGGTFTTGTTSAVDFATGNIDGTLGNDLLVLDGSSQNRRVNLLRANAQGGFNSPETVWSPSSGATNAFTTITVGDIDNDGDLDALLLQPQANKAVVLRRIDNGAYETLGNFSVPGSATDLQLADLDNDGDLDAVVTSRQFSGGLSFHYNNAPGLSPGSFTEFNAGATYTTIEYPSSVAVGDLDGDGRVDLAVSTDTNNSKVLVLRNATVGTSVAFSLIDTLPSGFETYEEPTVRITDVDGDGRRDIVMGRRNLVTVYRNQAGGSGATFREHQSISAPGLSVLTTNFNNDGIADFASLDQNGYVTLVQSLVRADVSLNSLQVSDVASNPYNTKLRATFRLANAQFVLYSSLGNGDFVLSNQTGFWQPGTFVGASVQPDNSMLITYEFPARLGAWDSTDNGSYALTLIANSLTQPGGRAFPSQNQTVWSNFLWFNAPTAERNNESVADAGTSMDLTVRYTDAAGGSIGISWDSITDGDVVLEREVTVAGNRVVVASIPGARVSRAITGNGQLTATYRFAAPGGYWDNSDNGLWTAKVVAGQVYDNQGNEVAPITLRSYNLFFAAPTARAVSFAAANGASTVTVTMEYQALGAALMDTSTFTTGDIELRGPNNYSAQGTLTGTSLSVTGGRTLYSVSYSFPAPGGVWNQTNQNQYSVWTRASQLRDASSRLVPAVALDMAPSARLASFVANPGAAAATITVDYQALGTPFMSWGSFGSGDIELRGPNGFVSVATMTSLSALQVNGAWVYRVVYSLAAPGGSWNSADNGSYSLWTRPNQILDNSGRLASSFAFDWRSLFY